MHMVSRLELDINTAAHPIRHGKRATPQWLAEISYNVYGVEKARPKHKYASHLPGMYRGFGFRARAPSELQLIAFM